MSRPDPAAGALRAIREATGGYADRGPGRPRSPDPRHVRVQIRFSAAEIARIRALAAASGKSFAAYVRDIACGSAL